MAGRFVAWLLLLGALRALGDDASTLFRAAAESYTKRDWENAARQYADYLQLYPSTPEAKLATYFLAESKFCLRDFAAARDLYEKYIATGGEDQNRLAWSEFRLGESSFMLRDYEHALRALSQFVSTRPDNALNAFALRDLGDIYTTLGDPENAERCFERSLNDFPNLKTRDYCLRGIKGCQAANRPGPSSVEDGYRIVLVGRTRQETSHGWTTMAAHYARQGDLLAALEAQCRVLELDPDNPTAEQVRQQIVRGHE